MRCVGGASCSSPCDACRASTSAGVAQKLAVVSWSSCAPVSRAVGDEEEEARVEAPRLRDGRDPARERVQRPEVEAQRLAPRAARRSVVRPCARLRRATRAARRAPARPPTIGRIAASSSASRHAAMARPRGPSPRRRRWASRVGRGGVDERSHAGSRSPASSLPPGKTIAPPRKPDLLPLDAEDLEPARRARRARRPASRRRAAAGLARVGSRSSMASLRESSRLGCAGAPRPRALSMRFCRRAPRPATRRRAPATRPRTRAPA